MAGYSEQGQGLSELEDGLDLSEEEMLLNYKQCVEDYLDQTREHRERARLAYNFRHGRQWTQEEIDILSKRGEPVLTFNMLGGKIGSMLGAEIVGRTDPKAVGRNPGVDQEAADMATSVLRYVCDKAKWPTERSLCRESYYVQGVMGADVCVDDRKKNGKNYKIEVKYIPYTRLFWDPHSEFADFRDAKYFGSVLWQDLADAKAEWKGDAKAIEALNNSKPTSEQTSTVSEEELDDRPGQWVAGTKRKRVRVVNIWKRYGDEWWTATYCEGGFMDGPRISPYVDSEGNTQPGMVLQSCYVRAENERYGIAEGLISAQEEINKRRSKALDLMSRKTVIADEGAVENVPTAQRELHKSSGWITKRRGYEMDVVDHQQQIVDNLTLMEQATSMLETIGPSEALMGQAGPNASGKSIETRQRSALLKYGDVLDGARSWELRVYEQIWHRVTQYWTEEEYVQISDDPQAPQWLGINVKKDVTMAEAMLRRGMTESDIQQLVAAGQLAPQALGQVVGQDVTNNLAQLCVDIILDTGPDYRSQAEQHTENLMSLLGQVGPQLPPKALTAAIEMLIEMAPLDSRIKKRFQEAMRPTPEEEQKAAQQQAMVEQLQQQMAALQLAKTDAEVSQQKAEVDLTKAKTDKEEASADKLMAEAALTARQIGMRDQPAQPTDR